MHCAILAHCVRPLREMLLSWCRGWCHGPVRVISHLQAFSDVAARLDTLEDTVMASQARLEGEVKRLAAALDGKAATTAQ